jgi:hypothetical protein
MSFGYVAEYGGMILEFDSGEESSVQLLDGSAYSVGNFYLMHFTAEPRVCPQ